MTLNVQFLTMLFMVVSGFYLGIALETFRRFSPLWRHRPVLVYIFEVSFWLIQTFIIFYVLYKVNAGELRVYIFLARSEEHTSELQSRGHLVCRLLLEKKKKPSSPKVMKI